MLPDRGITHAPQSGVQVRNAAALDTRRFEERGAVPCQLLDALDGRAAISILWADGEYFQAERLRTGDFNALYALPNCEVTATLPATRTRVESGQRLAVAIAPALPFDCVKDHRIIGAVAV